MHDMNGKPLAVGDRVTIPGVIQETSGDASTAFCNVTVKPDVPMGKGTPQEHPGLISLSAGQTAKVEPACPLAEAEEFLVALKGHYGQSEAGRAAAVALTHLQTARLWAQKASDLCEGVVAAEQSA